MMEKVLIVDDDANLLSGIKRQFRKAFNITTAEGGRKALSLARTDGPFAVVVCDMRMPDMDGVEVLGSLKESAPDTVRMMLTGNADQQTAVDAINEGSIFRFFTKPCPPEILAKGIEAGIEQYRLLTAEKDLLKNTLAGSVKVLIDVLSMIDADTFGKAAKAREWARVLARHFDLSQPWVLDLAVMLSRIGWVTIPAEIQSKVNAGSDLTPEEQKIIREIPEIGRKLIANIPRLDTVAETVYYQNKGFDGTGFPDETISGENIPLEARILKVLNDVAAASQGSMPGKNVFRQLESNAQLYDPDVFRIARQMLPKLNTGSDEEAFEAAEVPLSALIAGYELLSDIKTDDGKLILARDQMITETQLAKLRNISSINKIEEPIRIRKRKAMS